ncbi:hypothetical protein Acsp02_43660 [Actinoplanes sp. NBRC 103695]|nr:hypothetical protein Acsp02_43660 [Actinoplanes sp. NBRC 103695]
MEPDPERRLMSALARLIPDVRLSEEAFTARHRVLRVRPRSPTDRPASAADIPTCVRDGENVL